MDTALQVRYDAMNFSEYDAQFFFKVSSSLEIGSGQAKGDHVTLSFTEACCHQLEILVLAL
jgi:hypothetical protein